MREKDRPILTVPIGDIAGVGPEIVVKALAHREVYDWCRPLVVGEKRALERALEITGIRAALHCPKRTQEARYQYGTIDLVDLHNIDTDHIVFGRVQAEAGRAAFEFIAESVRLLQEKLADAIVTTTINKEALRAAKVPYIGHTEIIGGLLGAEDPMTMFEVRGLRVFFLSRHLSLADAIRYVTQENVYRYIRRCRAGMKSLGIEHPRIAVAGLNPHSGEHGLFGWEEVNEIAPAIARARRDGIEVEGPVGADSVFYLALQGKYDAVISLYHDQGHIATKMVDFERTISVTVGMPYIRTSVDHGTAFDIAGTNRVSEVSMYEALRLGAQYAQTYRSDLMKEETR